MKISLLKSLPLLAISMLSLTSCDIEEEPWWDNPPYGWESYLDTRLCGYWKLVQCNSDPVSKYETNYMYFNGNGSGYFYYFDNGYRERERLRYFCQDSGNGASNYQINIQYEFSSPITTSYWFTHGQNTLWLQWQTYGGYVQTYVYDRINYAPW